LANPPKAIAEEHLIVGEGDGDEAFFRHLCQARGIVGFGFDSASGNRGFERYLKGLKSQFPKRSLLIVADNDEAPAANFTNVQRQIDRAKFPQPGNPLQKASKLDFPDTVVLMLPYPPIGNSSRGALETLLLPATERHLPAQTICVDQYSQCVFAAGQPWSRTDADKMRLRCLLSGSSYLDPNVSLRHALDPQRNLIPLADPIFDPIALLLTHFVRWMQSQHLTWGAYRAANGL